MPTIEDSTLTRLRETLAGITQTSKLDDARKLAQRAQDLLAAVDNGDHSSASFATTLDGLGAALVDAQRRLDARSTEYSQQTKTGAPTLYRIPKLSVNFKFAMEKVEEKGISLLFYRKSEDQRELHQQSIELDIVAVPPPAQLLSDLVQGFPRIRLLIEPSVRARYRTALETLLTNEIVTGGGASKVLPRVVMLALPEPADAGTPFNPVLALYARTQGVSRVARIAWISDRVLASQHPQFAQLWPVDPPSDSPSVVATHQKLHDIIAVWADAQERVLEQLIADPP